MVLDALEEAGESAVSEGEQVRRGNAVGRWPGTAALRVPGGDAGVRVRGCAHATPPFPFGYGLSYTTFGYSGLNVSGPDAHGNSTVTATVTNTGSRAGSDVAQLYLTAPAAAGEPGKLLKGFQRVYLQPGAGKQITFSVPAHSLAYWNSGTSKWTTGVGAYGIAVGNTSGSPQLTGTLNVTTTNTGNTVTLTRPAGMSSPVGSPASLPLHASDSASGQNLTWTAEGLPAGLAINAGTGTVSGTPTTAATSTVTVTATDSTGAAGSESFVWTTTPVGGGPQRIVSGLASTLCLDVQAANPANGTAVQTYTCNGTSAQQWTTGTDGTVRSLGKCLDVTAAGTANSTKVQLYDCNGTGAQTWQHRSDGSFLNPVSGRCLDVQAASTTPGTQLQIYDCNNSPAQVWTLAP